MREEACRLFYRHRCHLADVLAADLHLAGFAAQAQAAAIGAHGISAIAAEEDAHMQLVLLALQVLEEAAHPPELPIAADDKTLLIGREVLPRHVKRDAGGARVTFHLRGVRPVLGLGPRFDCALGQRQGLVWDYEVEIEIDGVAESLAARARSEGVVEGEQPRLRLIVADVALLALEALREAEALRGLAFARSGLEDYLSCFTIALLHGIHDAQARLGRYGDAIDQHQHRLRKVHFQQRFRRREFKNLAVLI